MEWGRKDVYKRQTSSSVNNLNPVYETLVRYDDDGEIKPLLATEWKRLDDLNWEFKLREDVYKRQVEGKRAICF